jgi:hypothetical protein
MKEIEEFKLAITYKCPIKNKTISKIIKDDDISSSESPCDMCGSHGDITIDVGRCPACKKFHKSIKISTW